MVYFQVTGAKNVRSLCIVQKVSNLFRCYCDKKDSSAIGSRGLQKEPSESKQFNFKVKYRQTKFNNPIERTLKILADDIRLGLQLDDLFARKHEKQHEIEEIFPNYCDVVIIGGGAIGTSVAYHLKEFASRGLRVVVVEKDPGYAVASSARSVGGIRQQFSIPENILLSLYGIEFLRKVPKLLAVRGVNTPSVNFSPQGYLTLATEEGYDILKETFTMQRDVGAKVELISSSKIKSRHPWMNTDNISAGIMGLENEGWFDPWSLLVALRQKALDLGVQFVNGNVISFAPQSILEDADARQITCYSRKKVNELQVDLGDGDVKTINFAMCVIAAGAWSSEIGKLAGIGTAQDGILSVALPIEPRKRFVYHIHAPDGPGLDCPFVIDHNKTYFRREGLGNYYLCGSSPSPDKEPPIDDLEVDHDYFNNSVWPSLVNRSSLFENLKVKNSWAGYYDYNYFDQNGIVGNHPMFTNVFIAAGFSGHGIQQAAGIGRAVMEAIIFGEYKSINLTRFGFERVLLNEPLLELNII